MERKRWNVLELNLKLVGLKVGGVGAVSVTVWVVLCSYLTAVTVVLVVVVVVVVVVVIVVVVVVVVVVAVVVLLMISILLEDGMWSMEKEGRDSNFFFLNLVTARIKI